MEIFLEAVQLEEVGEFERADVTPGVADFFLQVAHDLEEIGEGEAGAEELEPEPLPVKTETEVLTGEAAIGLVQLHQDASYPSISHNDLLETLSYQRSHCGYSFAIVAIQCSE
jgi:hypothetical protein